MSGRHDALVSQRRRWAPTALGAVAAITPTAALAVAFGLAGGGYLTSREDLAACGALAGALGVVAERFAARRVRVRLRRERACHRDDLQDVNRVLNGLRRDLADLRAGLDDVQAQRDAVRAELLGTREELEEARAAAIAAEGPDAAGRLVVEDPDAGVEPAEAEPARPPLSLLVPGQARSPIATGGIPVLEPGPREPVRVVDLRTAGSRPEPDDDTQPIPLRPARLADALVYAAIAQAEAAELTRRLEVPGAEAGGRHAGPLHKGDAHHAGDYARGQAAEGSLTAALYIVRQGKHVA